MTLLLCGAFGEAVATKRSFPVPVIRESQGFRSRAANQVTLFSLILAVIPLRLVVV